MKSFLKYYRQFGAMTVCSASVVLVILFSGCGGGGGSSNSNAKGSINGKVRNSESTALPGVTVTAGGKSTTTDNSGNFTLNDIPVGTQLISASLTGYFNDGRGSASVQIVEDKTTNVSGLILVPTSNGQVFIWHLKASNTDYESPKQKQLGGAIYYDSLFTGYLINDSKVAIYSIGRRYSRFKATVGVADDEYDLNAEVVFKVIGDGNVLYQSQQLKVGAIENIDVDVSDILTLQLQVDRIAGTGIRNHYTAIVWGDARLSIK